ncbi:MAG: bifunctional metallophosphatase/5'-nucleotidase [Erysipelotrichaceae bacterium]|nr:bifunctional metallophosphatase/5'-nucleotidase [Erysipelotrichaceae bacterium]
MKFKKAVTAAMAALLMVTPASVFAKDDGSSEEVNIVYTHDIHSFLEYKKDQEQINAAAKLKSYIDSEKQKKEATFVVDAGDFSMGTLYGTGFQTEALELMTLGRLGYDAVTLGNHEFDFGPEGLTAMFQTAVAKSKASPDIQMPLMVQSNIDWDKSTDSKAQDLKKAMSDYGVLPYAIVEKDGIKAGIFGLLGENAVSDSPTSGLSWTKYTEAAAETVKELKKENPDIIICLSHSGTWTDPAKSEDEILAKEVPDIDVIISGHTHTVHEKQIEVGNTAIVSCGCYAAYVGDVQLERKSDGRWKVTSDRVIPMAELKEEDEEINDSLRQAKETVAEQYLKKLGFESPDQVLAVNKAEFAGHNSPNPRMDMMPFGEFAADALIYGVQQAEGENYEKVDFSIVPIGITREVFPKGEVTVADAFQAYSLGLGNDGSAGNPLISFYLTGREIRDAVEIDASLAPLLTDSDLMASGGGWAYNENRLLLNKVTDVWVNDENGSPQPLEDDKLYRFIIDLYSIRMLAGIEAMSHGLISITPKDKNGNPIEKFEDHSVKDQNGNELKEWIAVARYAQSFDKENGVPVIPAEEGQEKGRKIVSTSTDLGELLKNPNRFAWMFAGVTAAFIALIVLIIWAIVHWIRKRKKRTVQAQ